MVKSISVYSRESPGRQMRRDPSTHTPHRMSEAALAARAGFLSQGDPSCTLQRVLTETHLKLCGIHATVLISYRHEAFSQDGWMVVCFNGPK